MEQPWPFGVIHALLSVEWWIEKKIGLIWTVGADLCVCPPDEQSAGFAPTKTVIRTPNRARTSRNEDEAETKHR